MTSFYGEDGRYYHRSDDGNYFYWDNDSQQYVFYAHENDTTLRPPADGSAAEGGAAEAAQPASADAAPVSVPAEEIAAAVEEHQVQSLSISEPAVVEQPQQQPAESYSSPSLSEPVQSESTPIPVAASSSSPSSSMFSKISAAKKASVAAVAAAEPVSVSAEPASSAAVSASADAVAVKPLPSMDLLDSILKKELAPRAARSVTIESLRSVYANVTVDGMGFEYRRAMLGEDVQSLQANLSNAELEIDRLQVDLAKLVRLYREAPWKQTEDKLLTMIMDLQEELALVPTFTPSFLKSKAGLFEAIAETEALKRQMEGVKKVLREETARRKELIEENSKLKEKLKLSNVQVSILELPLVDPAAEALLVQLANAQEALATYRITALKLQVTQRRLDEIEKRSEADGRELSDLRRKVAIIEKERDHFKSLQISGKDAIKKGMLYENGISKGMFGSSSKSMKLRFFEVKDGWLICKENENSTKLLAEIGFRTAQLTSDMPHDPETGIWPFKISVAESGGKNKEFILGTLSEEDRKHWLSILSTHLIDAASMFMRSVSSSAFGAPASSPASSKPKDEREVRKEMATKATGFFKD